ncbi:MarR family winged helix-turn-helix transcriptional regulator [Secundilactobacillus folii]|uniref:MarR family transcriptional regulator n=1 Tax=Secundilactobacillus folii TaxID=2678357 RepID=A0A7X3C190_9LACO|nr:MarR family transcriptional regulator [Secundilactobacillus folii]MTV81480.1 MarR family transcriptional regulator [Secundilactobacillus folii]
MAAKNTDPHELGQLFTALNQAILQNRTLSEFGLTNLQSMTLKNVYLNPGISMGDLAEETGIARAQLTRLITNLEARNLVRREHNQTNRRMVNVFGTDHGQSVMQKHRQIIEKRIQGHIQTLNNSEQAALAEHLRKSIQLMVKSGIIKPSDKLQFES